MAPPQKFVSFLFLYKACIKIQIGKKIYEAQTSSDSRTYKHIESVYTVPNEGTASARYVHYKCFPGKCIRLNEHFGTYDAFKSSINHFRDFNYRLVLIFK